MLQLKKLIKFSKFIVWINEKLIFNTGRVNLMRKEILKSKICLIALASILLVSCGGGGGGSSNLPLRPTPNVPNNPSIPSTPNNPSTPSKPSTPSNPEDNFSTITNPLDSQKGDMSALKAKLNT